MTSEASSGSTVAEQQWQSLMPGLGSLVTLISHKQIRYEGALYSVNADHGKITLANVRCFGTEDRDCRRPVRSSDQVYEYVVFSAHSVVKMEITKGCPYLFPPHAPIRRDPAVRLVATFGRRWGEEMSSSGDTLDTLTTKDKAQSKKVASVASLVKNGGNSEATDQSAEVGDTKPARRVRFFPRRGGGQRSSGVRATAGKDHLPTVNEVSEEGELTERPAPATAAEQQTEYPDIEVKRTQSPVVGGADLMPLCECSDDEIKEIEEVAHSDKDQADKQGEPKGSETPAENRQQQQKCRRPGLPSLEAPVGCKSAPPNRRRDARWPNSRNFSLPQQIRMRRWATSAALAPERSVPAGSGRSTEADGDGVRHFRPRRELIRYRRQRSCPVSRSEDGFSPPRRERSVSDSQTHAAGSVLRWSINDAAKGTSLFSIFDKLADETEAEAPPAPPSGRWGRRIVYPSKPNWQQTEAAGPR